MTIEEATKYTKENSNCELLSNIFISYSEKLKFKCSCGNIFFKSFSAFKKQNGKQCRECGIKIRSEKSKLKKEDVKKEMHESGLNLIGDYVNNVTPMLVSCSNGHNYYTTLASYRAGKQCPECTKFKHSVEEISNFFNIDGYKMAIPLIEPIGCSDLIDIICPNGHIFSMDYHHFKAGNRCKYCVDKSKGGKQNTKTIDIFKKELYDLVGDEYIYIDGYTKASSKAILYHSICGNYIEILPSKFLKGKRCKYCQHQSFRKTIDEFKQEVFDIYSDEYSVLGDYLKNDIPISIKHNVCGNIFNIRPSNLLLGGGCAKCSCKSRKEETIKRFLIKINLEFDREVRFTGCKDKRELPFDFLVKLPNGYKFLIEYQGQQHYGPVSFTGGIISQKEINQYEYIKRHDEIKYNYCLENNIDLLIIPYWEFKNYRNMILKEIAKINPDTLEVLKKVGK